MTVLTHIPAHVKDVLVRVDYNLPRRADGSISEVARIENTAQTICYLRDQGKNVRLLTHWGRPHGFDADFSVELLRPSLEKVLGAPVYIDSQPLRDGYEPVPHPISICENVRFYPEEEKNDPQFVHALAARGEVFVNEAFSVSHRKHASVYGLSRVLPTYIGFDCVREWQNCLRIQKDLDQAVVLVGGCKIETKLPLICKLLPVVKKMMLGALLGLALRNFLLGKYQEGDVLQDYADVVRKHMHKVILPLDVNTPSGPQSFEAQQDLEPVVDIGPLTIDLYSKELAQSNVVFMNGPVGQYEVPVGAQGTYELGKTVMQVAAQNTQFRAFLGGGDTVAALYRHFSWPENVTFSSAGGALLYFMTYGTLPCLESIHDEPKID